MPDNIKRMLGNYNKIAIINLNNTIEDVGNDVWKSKNINISLSFVPKRMFIRVFQNLSNKDIVIDTNIHNKSNYAEGQDVKVYVNGITQSSFTLNVYTSIRWVNFSVKEIIAIG